MLYEYALEPSLLNSWERFRYLTERFGVAQGRLISRYPRRWKALVYGALDACSEIEKKRIEERLSRVDERMMYRESDWNPAFDWLHNAEAEHGRRPFHAILARVNPRANGAVLLADDLHEETPGWHVGRERVVQRQAPAMADAVAPLLRIARVIVFVDPHFSPYNNRSRSALHEYLARVRLRQGNFPIERIEFHTSFRPEIAGFNAECLRQLPQRIPSGLRVRIVQWRERDGGDSLHNRYIFTDRGGVRLAWGLDEGAPAETDDLSLLEDALFHTRWEQYCGANPAFDLGSEITIEGTL